ncbi:MAG: isoleucine--tRNA ligase [Candidatus Omnitrophota bacterium]
MDYKNTLNLPKTDFPMKADLPKREPLFLKDWELKDIYRLILDKAKSCPKYILHDGPPYANGNIHIGHALNKTLKDIIVKYKTLRGFYSPFVPGWDCHGLPVEHQLFKELKMNKYQITQVDFRKKAHDYAVKYISIQKEEFKRLGVFGDWDNPYLTLSHDYEEAILNSFKELVKNDYIYRGRKPVNWCYRCETALAEAEVEYENHTSPSVFVKFKLDQAQDMPNDTYLVIWTTTPWTLLANVAVAVHPDFAYSYISTGAGILIIADVRLGILEKMGIKEYEVVRQVKGRGLEGFAYEHPFNMRKGKVVLADYVSSEEGSGLVHTAPGHGQEDYLTGLKYKLEIVMPVDTKGNFDLTTGEFKGLNVHAANEVIIDKLRSLNLLLLAQKLEHSYPHCWRCKNPVIFRATNQWFLAIDKHDLRKKMLEVINKDIEWIPALGRERILGMVNLRPDWCLSRQRYWGVPIPSLVCDNCHEEFLDIRVIDNFAKSVAKEGSDSWFIRDIGDFAPKDLLCPKCQGRQFKKGMDILDVWFDSGVSHQAVLKKRKELGGVPCELYLEGSDQHRGWFQSSLIPGMCIDAKPPFKAVLTHGHVVDGEGRKMSKSLGNVIHPQDIIKQYGADIVRLWVASSDYNEDIRISPEIISRLVEAYRKIRNTARFILSNLYDYNVSVDRAGYDDLNTIDKWTLSRLQEVITEVSLAYDQFEFYKAYKCIYDFCNLHLSTSYLDMVKGRLYTAAAKSKERRAAQTVIYESLFALTRMIAPILIFTAEEIWQNIPKEKECMSVFLLEWPKPNLDYTRNFNRDFITYLYVLLPDITQALEEKRSAGIIGSSFDAKIKLLTKDEKRYKYLGSLNDELCEIFKVSQVEIEKIDKFSPDLKVSSNFADVAIQIDKAQGQKCQRCWNYSHSVGNNDLHNLICSKCIAAIGGEKN